jgi:hypothetical protein
MEAEGVAILHIGWGAPASSAACAAAQVEHPIITPATHQPNTPGDRVMSYELDGSRRNSSPVAGRVE